MVNVTAESGSTNTLMKWLLNKYDLTNYLLFVNIQPITEHCGGGAVYQCLFYFWLIDLNVIYHEQLKIIILFFGNFILSDFITIKV